MLGMGALTVFLIGLSINYEVNTITTVSLFFVLNGLVASSRLVMNAHSNQELAIGFLCGSIPQMVLLFLWL